MMMFFALNICVHLWLFLQEKLQQMELLRSKGSHGLVASNAYYQNVLYSTERFYGFILLREYAYVHFAVFFSILGINIKN